MMHSFKATAREDDAAQKKLSAPEREARLDFQSSDSDAWISQPLEPAQALYDSCASMVDKNEIAYIGPGKYLSRQHELMWIKLEEEIQLDVSKTVLVLKEQQTIVEFYIA